MCLLQNRGAEAQSYERPDRTDMDSISPGQMSFVQPWIFRNFDNTSFVGHCILGRYLEVANTEILCPRVGDSNEDLLVCGVNVLMVINSYSLI